jgi:uncharacterized protein (TIGR00661 family)
MKILYAIQGTGNGHVSRARDIVPLLAQKGELDILISNEGQADVKLDYPIKYRMHGQGFIFGKKGGVDLLETYKKANLKQFWKEVKTLPVKDYDIVISDFEPVSAWACYLAKKPCVGLSHQAAVVNKKSPKPKKTDLVGSIVLKYYAPATVQYGFHFNAYDKNIYTPVIRQQVRNLQPTQGNYYIVYLPAYSDKKILNVLSHFKNEKWVVFSKHNKKPFTKGNISFTPPQNEAFLQSLAGCKGVLCGAGFETPAEAFYLQKKLLVIPMKNQYEQQCNAAALKEMGVPVVKSLKEKHLDKIRQWLQSEQALTVHYPDITAAVLEEVIGNYQTAVSKMKVEPDKKLQSSKGLRNFILRKLFARLTV